MRLVFVTVSLGTKYTNINKNIVSKLYPDSKHIIVDGSSNWPYPAFTWVNIINNIECDYLILLDEDCFLTSKEDLNNVISYMSDNNITLCGPSDGYSMYRSANASAMNTFFMIINKEKFIQSNIEIDNIKFGFNEKGWFNNLYPNYSNEIYEFVHDETVGSSNTKYEQEPYYFIFWYLIKLGHKLHFLYQEFDTELKSTNLKLNKTSNSFCIHMWYLRQYQESFDVHGIQNNKRYELLDKKLLDDKINIGLLIICTNKYIRFLNNLIKSADNYFLINQNVNYYIFTNHDSIDIDSNRNINLINIKHKDWPWMTLGRYDIFNNNRDILSKEDYLYYCDVDMLFNDFVGDEILSDRVATIHPGFLGSRGTPETNRFSKAFVNNWEDMTYFAGGFNGGLSNEYLKMSKELSDNIKMDYDNGIIAIWHDESHMNRYFINNKPTKILDPGYCYGESMIIPYTKRLIALDKNHKEIRSDVLISILLAVYNDEKYIKESIDSILSQSYNNFELLIGLNGCTDNTKDIVKSYIDNRIKIFEYDIPNKSKTLNNLIRESKSDWISIQDSDDIWSIIKLEEQYKIIIQNEFNIIGTFCEYIDENNNIIGSPIISSNSDDIINKSFNGDNQLINMSVIFKKSNLTYWDESINGIEDYDLWLRLISNGYKPYNIPKKLVKHRLHNKSNFNTKQYDIKKLINKYSKEI